MEEKNGRISESNSKKARIEYGKDALDVTSDISPDDIIAKKHNIAE